MSEAGMTLTNPACVSVAVRVGRNGWVRKEATLHYESSRLIKVDGIELAQAGPLGLTGIMYVVKDAFRRDNRPMMRLERQKIVNGMVVDIQNWGETDDAEPRAA